MIATENNDFLRRSPFWFYLKTYPRSLAVGMGALIITNFLDGMWPLVLKKAVDQISTSVALNEIERTAAIFFLIMVGLSATRYTWRVGFGRFHTMVAEHLRMTSFRHLSSLTPSYFLRKPIGELMSLLTNDVQAFRQALGNGLLIFADGIITLTVILPIMWTLNPDWTWKSLIFLPFVPLLIWVVMRKIHVASKRQQDAFASVTAHSQESIAGIRVLKGFALEDVRLRQFGKENRELESASNASARIDAFFSPVMEFGVTSGTIIFLFIARDDLLSGALSVGTFVAFHRYILKTVWPMTALGLGLSQLQKGFAAFDRIREMLNEKEDLKPNGAEKIPAFESLEFRNVGFHYPMNDFWIFRGMNWRIEKGQSLGIAGPVGAGKTTLLALVTRQFDPSEGEIFLNDRPLTSFSLEEVRRCLTLVPQDVFLFSDSVTWNVGFGREENFTDLEAADAAKRVDIHDEMATLPEGYQSLIGEKGVNLSGGQKQRLALARGLVMDSQVLLLDDVLSAVDTKTESRIDELLSKLRSAGRTQFLVAHRYSTLMTCDHLLVLNRGVVEIFAPRETAMKESAFLKNLRQLQTEASDE